ncbi:hypothetical protein [Estrella lausannensis]|uniref:Uncharacterized protein n=1 Tax=Estrella lausannensis TaxID=483423 RepID=A0A0H5DRV2_9BACT|nr:hypothetical protein [Estrella lausannensis]CRX38958.1 hypothetical protein ELAC_1630 [Estrella lausannensis]
MKEKNEQSILKDRPKDSPVSDPAQVLESALLALSSLSKESPQDKNAFQGSSMAIREVKDAVVSFFKGKPFDVCVRDFFSGSNILLEAVETIKRYYPLIEKFKEGTPREKNLAAFALETIQKHNKIVERRRHMNFAEKATGFIFKTLGMEKKRPLDSKIIIPVQTSFQTKEDKESSPATLFTKSVLTPIAEEPHSASSPTKSERDMFRMKAIMLLKQHNLSVKMIEGASEEVAGEGPSEGIISFRQFISTLPGEEIELTGQFKRLGGKVKRSIPLIETFRLQAKSHQTGFPHPLQLAGFAFSDSLFPACPLRPEAIPDFYRIHKKMEEAAVALLPKGRLNEAAKENLCLKINAFNEGKDDYIELHLLLATAFRKIRTDPSSYVNEAPGLFFSSVGRSKDPFSEIASAYERFNDLFIKEQKKRLYEKHISLFSVADSRERKEALTKAYREGFYKGIEKLNEESSSSEKRAYILYLAALFEESILSLFLQELSEVAGFDPQLLSEGDRIIQAALFNQFDQFYQEINNPLKSKQEAAHCLENNLKEAIDLFERGINGTPPLAKLIQEMETYYLSRKGEATSHLQS